MMKKLICFFILALFFSGVAFSQSPSVSATLDKQKILIGEQVHLYVKALIKKNHPAAWFTIDSLPHFEILQRSKVDSQPTSEGLFLQQTITLTSWDSGRWLIPALTLGKVKTKPLVMDVGYTPMPPGKPYNDVHEILEVQKPIASNWYWYLLGIAVLIALFLLFFPPKEEKSVEQPPAPPEDAFKVAMSRIQKLNAEEEAKYFYTELIDTFREYLEKRKGIQSFSKTTDDLAVQMRQLELPLEQYTQLVQVLRMSDMVKFAKFQPQRYDKEQALKVVGVNIVAIEKLK
jgi:hypothetical protein